ncbi:hypothetical protein EPO05_03000 [Patescibacteria group bacterium]|nr:MAG: hypothetical protein EPO05_03000 [Patescibacteria group bacterium]
MGMQQKAIVIGGLVAVFILPIVGYLIWKSNIAPVAGPERSLMLEAKDGGLIAVADPQQSGEFLLREGIYVKRATRFEILYNTIGKGSFEIRVWDSLNLNGARTLAEQDLLRILNVSEAEMCQLDVTLTVPEVVNRSLAGKNYGLSFCEDGKSF